MIDIKFRLDNYGSEFHFEIGSGTFEFLCNQAEHNKDNYYVGTEIQEDFFKNKYLSQPKKYQNIDVFNVDGLWLLRQLSDNCIDSIHIYYPSPYPSKKYEWKDVLNLENIQLYKQKMKLNGQLRIVTDNSKYYQNALNSILISKLWVKNWEYIYGIDGNKLVGTKCEEEYQDESNKQYAIMAIKI